MIPGQVNSLKVARLFLVLIFLTVAVGLISFFNSRDLEKVNFCGRTFYSKKIYVDGKNVMQRLSEIALTKPKNSICWNLGNKQENTVLTVRVEPCKFTQASCLYIKDSGTVLYIQNGKFLQPEMHGSSVYGDL